MRGGARVAFVAYALALGVVLLNPSAYLGGSAVTFVAEHAELVGLPDWLVQWGRLEFLMNVAVLMPLSVLGMRAWPATQWVHWTSYGFVISALVEGVQAVAYAGRSATYVDIVANTAGALSGALIGALWRWRPGGSARRGRDAPATGRPT